MEIGELVVWRTQVSVWKDSNQIEYITKKINHHFNLVGYQLNLKGLKILDI